MATGDRPPPGVPAPRPRPETRSTWPPEPPGVDPEVDRLRAQLERVLAAHADLLREYDAVAEELAELRRAYRALLGTGA